MPLLSTSRASSPGLAAIRAAFLALVGVLTGSQALVAGGCFFLALAISRFTKVRALRSLAGSSEQADGFHSNEMIFLGALILSMAVGLAGHSVVLLEVGIGLNRVNPFALLAAVISILLSEPGTSAPSAIVRWVFPTSGQLGTNPQSHPAIASFIVLIGVLGNVAHLASFDPVAALLLAGLAFRAGWQMIVDA